MDCNSSIGELKGIGTKTEQLFHKIGVYSLTDMLLHFPRNFIQYPKIKGTLDIKDGQLCAIYAQMTATPILRKTPKMAIVTGVATDGQMSCHLTWFRMPYIIKQLTSGKWYVFYGKAIKKQNQLLLEQAKIFGKEDYEELKSQLQPVYGLTNGMTNNLVKKTVKQILDAKIYPDSILTEEIRKTYDFLTEEEAYEQMHFPSSLEAFENARRCFAYEEFLLFFLGIKIQKEQTTALTNEFQIHSKNYEKQVIDQLPYQLTNAQQETLKDVWRDISGIHCMQRLVQGDVGSGKTIVAFLTMFTFAENGYQSALMAPTEVLARQHYESMEDFIKTYDLPFEAILLTGSLKASEKKNARQRLKTNPSLLAIGTNALIQEGVEFCNLGLVITDEQHRFGVRQREALSGKGQHPHIMVMSATPIPRTLAIILYGDLDISVMDELPARRLPIKNCVIDQSKRAASYKHILEQVRLGHQAYVICPLVEESENLEAEDAVSYVDKLQDVWKGSVKVEFLHGRMKAEEKNKIMERFSKNEIQVLVSTTVIEVGINVPNATVMMIENADRFGLAQLHQLRGRVGRGAAQSYCILVNGSDSKKSKERLEILNHSNDGFFIAEEDLKLRGPGDYFGIRQSGDLVFRTGDIYQDEKLLKQASQDAGRILENDGKLELPEHGILKEKVLSYIKEQAVEPGL